MAVRWPASFGRYAHKDAALRHVAETLAAASPPFDGLMGFSQGGSLAVWVAALQQRGTLQPPSPPIRFLWVQSARTPRDPACRGLFDAPLALPAFVSLAEDDTEVKAHETRKLISHLADPWVVQRSAGGHALLAMARRPEDGDRLRQFLITHRG